MFDLRLDELNREQYLVNGELVDEGALPHPLRNRGFQYADGFFETIRVAHGVPQHLALHFGRIQDSCRAYRMDVPGNWTAEWFFQRLLSLARGNRISEGGRIRLTFFRGGGGRYTPESDEVMWVGEAEALEHNEFKLNENGYRVDIFPEMRKPLDHVANFKTCPVDCTCKVRFGRGSGNLRKPSSRTPGTTSSSQRGRTCSS